MFRELKQFLIDMTDDPESPLNALIRVADNFRNYMNNSLDFPISDKVEALCEQFKELLSKECKPRIRLGRICDDPYFIDLNKKTDGIVAILKR